MKVENGSVKIFKKPSSKNVTMATCPMAETTTEVEIAGGFVDISFTSGTVNKASDFTIELRAADFAPMMLEAIAKGQPKQLQDYSLEDLRKAYEEKVYESFNNGGRDAG